MLVKTYCAAVNGLEVTTVTVEVSLNQRRTCITLRA